MTTPRKWTFSLASILVVAIVAGVIAQDFWDDESLFAEEEATVDAAIDGELADDESDSNDDDVFDALFDNDDIDDFDFDDWDAEDIDDAEAPEVAVVADDDADDWDDWDDDDLDDLFGSLPDDEVVDPEDEDLDLEEFAELDPEKGITPDADVLDDLDSLFADLAEDDEDPEPDPEPVIEPDPEPVIEREPDPTPVVEPEPELDEVDPADVVYDDDDALDDALFDMLADEGRRIAEDTSVETEDTPDPAVEREVVEAPRGSAAFEEAERLRRVARENHAINSLERAERLLREREYRRAIQLFEEALRTLPQRADLEPARARARRGAADAHFRQAAALVEMGNFESALSAAQSAARLGHRRGPDAVRRIQERIDAPEEDPEPKPAEHRWEEEEFLEIDREIERWLRRGREAYLNGEYERAILAFESVLARDPEHKEAIRMMRAASGRQFDRSTMELDATRQRMMTDVRRTWNPRQYGLHEEPIDEEDDLVADIREDEIQRQRILDKMEEIVIPEISFRQENIRDVLTFLQDLSVEFDPAPTRAERTGVNIILQLDSGRRRATADNGRTRRRADPFADPDDVDGVRAAEDVPVSFTARNISLREALDIVVDVANLRYRIRGNVVVVVPRDHDDGDIIHRMYDVLPSAIARLQDLSTAAEPRGRGGARRGSGDFLALDGGQDLAGEDVDLRAFFEEMGVRWPTGSSIKFIRGLGKLVVANTQENLAVFESILSILNVVPYQIEIEARFIEVAQTDVDSLGLEWMLTDAWQIAEMAADGNLPAASRRRLVMQENATDGGFTRGNRFLPQGDSRGPLGSPIMDQVATVSSVLTNPELTMVLHALQQRGHTDLLSAPKITTQSGQQATIKVVTEYIYPTAFETSGIGGTTTGGTLAGTDAGTVGAVVTPLDFQTREVGVILEVLPEVSPEGQMINLLLSPEVVSEPTWRNYGSTYTSFDPNGNPIEQQLNMEQPFFHTRQLRTNLLIYNGATVVMGGMITEERYSVDDSIPLLGDIPIFGRLFRSRYDSSEKRNLLIFVTARLVDPAGRPLDREHVGIDDTIAERIAGVELED